MCFLRKNEKLLSILNFQFHETIRFENSTLSDLKIKSPSFARTESSTCQLFSRSQFLSLSLQENWVRN